MIAGPLVDGRDLLDDGLDPLRVVVALALDLLGLGQQRLDTFAQLHERVARVGLLNDAGDQLADAVAVLLVHHVALGLADALQNHLLGGLRCDPAEVVGGDVALLDLVSVFGELLRVDFRFLGFAHLARLGIDRRFLIDRLDDQVRLQALGDDQFDDPEVGGLAVHFDARVLGGARLLLVRGQQRVLQRDHQLLGLDALLARQRVHCLEYFA